jgi:hypothetical protein
MAWSTNFTVLRSYVLFRRRFETRYLLRQGVVRHSTVDGSRALTWSFRVDEGDLGNSWVDRVCALRLGFRLQLPSAPRSA